MSVAKWEYARVRASDVDKFDNLLKQFGQVGWELVSTHYLTPIPQTERPTQGFLPVGPPEPEWVAFFKRPIAQ